MLNWFKLSFSQIGKSATFYYLIDKILRKIRLGSIYPYYYLSQPLDNSDKKIRLSKHYRVTKIAPDDPKLLQLLPQSICDYRFQQGAVCIGAFKEDILTALLWFTPGSYFEDEVRATFIPPSDGCWDFGVYIDPDYRMTKAFSSLWITSTRIMQDMGFHNSFSRISAFNPNSLKSHIRMGAKLMAKTIFVNIGPVQFSFSNMKPICHISFSDKSPVVLHF